jgi:hypothetical protein
MKPYPDIEPLLAQKEAWRKAQAALPYEEKIKIVAKLSGWKIDAETEPAAPPANAAKEKEITKDINPA